MTKWLLLIFLTLGMHGMYRQETVTVTAVERGLVTMVSDTGTTYNMDEAEAWRVGDRAECVVGRNRIIDIRYLWRKR